MTDYISREAALSMPWANGQYDHEHANEHFICGLETYKEWLEQIPPADVVVVRCKDCLHDTSNDPICPIPWVKRMLDSYWKKVIAIEASN